MSSPRAIVAAILLASFGGAALAQSLAEVAEQEKRKRSKGPTRVYTNEDLLKGASPADKDKPSPSPAAVPSPETGPDSPGNGVAWRARAEAARAAVRGSETHVKQIEERIAMLNADVAPTGFGDPFRLQTLEAQKAQARAELDKAKEALSKAQKALEDLEDEARRQGIPPGWLREP